MPFSMDIPALPGRILRTLQEAGYPAYLVGGCVRDALLGQPSEDYDIATAARPEEVRRLFPKSRAVGQAFAVMLVEGCEVATFRTDGAYSDFRHPDSIAYAETIEEDLARRDFTFNAMAYDGSRLVDPYGGREDLERRVLRFVRDPRERMTEDPLRALRACRFAAKTGSVIEEASALAIMDLRSLLDRIVPERKQMELSKMLLGRNPDQALGWTAELGLLVYLLPEMEASRGCDQPPHHAEDCWEHALETLKCARRPDLALRLACLVHDVAKPACKAPAGEGRYTFYNHDVRGDAPITAALERLRYSNQVVNTVREYARYHMRPLLYGCQMKDPALQRLMGELEYISIRDLLRFMLCDVRGNLANEGKGFAFTLEITRPVLERVRRIEREGRVLRISDLPVNGADLMAHLGLPPGPKVGALLKGLYEYALKHPDADREKLLFKAGEFVRHL